MYAWNLILATAEPVPISAETATESGGIDLLLPAPEELIAGIIAFAIIFFVVWKFALPSLKKTLQARQDAIKDELTAAERAKEEAASLLEDYRQQVAGAKEEAAQIVAEARDAGEAVKADIVARAEAEAQSIKARAADEVAADRARVAEELRRQVADLSINVAERVVASGMDEARQRELVDRYIEELGGVR
ncbi:MAG: F0F1 ATP synthase subunit B [Acidimicrobiia bacterium]